MSMACWKLPLVSPDKPKELEEGAVLDDEEEEDPEDEGEAVLDDEEEEDPEDEGEAVPLPALPE
jgi:hypothetical protein